MKVQLLTEYVNKNFNDLNKAFSLEINDSSFKENPFLRIYMIYEKEDVVAYLSFYHEYEKVEIENIEVLEEYRKKGYGSILMDELISFCKREKIENITLEVNELNDSAIRLYEKFDFKKVSIRKGYYDGIDGILMERKIAMKDTYILGIESSCDETSVSIVKNGCEEIATVVLSQIDIHKNYGGVVPEIASRNHVKNITMVIEECLDKANMSMDLIDAIAVTYGPGLIGSLLVGLEAAKTLSFVYQKPLVPVHHIMGHIYANNLVKPLEFPLICLVISGGHTELVLMDKHLSFKKLGSTLDDAVGECYDKVARVIGVSYPGGPVIDKMAHEGNNNYKLPIPLDDNSYNFSFSGLKSAVINLVHNEEQRGNEINKEDLATSFQNVVVETLTKKTMKALKEYNVNNLIVAGGVAANKGIREELTELCEKNNINLSFPEMKYCTDNAAMIAAVGYFLYKDGKTSTLELNSKSTSELK